uniref:Cathepsin propeptide inhibitor domain-containing protein n=1 Tax=Timema poppense TaxID=170557 RepID=A0A7R9DL85_TIMPO|nr:unnamed protein product [Timema poppensis]
MLELRKRRVWEDNLHRINKHNAEATIGHHSYTLRANHLADMTARQYVRQMVKLTKSRRRRIGDNLVGGVNYQQLDIPEELDWRKKGFVTRSLNQLDCGSCYAFSIVTAIEGQLFKQTGQYTELRSAQPPTDSGLQHNNGKLRVLWRISEKHSTLFGKIRRAHDS